MKKAVSWSSLEFLLSQLINVGLIAILARVLEPDDFGTYALLGVFLGFSTTLVEGGLGLALVQKSEVHHIDRVTAFWTSILIGGIISVLLSIFARNIGAFFSDPRLEKMLYLMSVTILVSSFGVVPRATLLRELNFARLAQVTIAALFLSGVVTVIFANLGFGVFALSVNAFLNVFVVTVLLWTAVRWWPSVGFSFSALKELMSFGGFILLSSLLEVTYTKTVSMYSGKIFGTYSLGQFNRAESAANLVSGLVSNPLSKIVFPIFSRTRKEIALLEDLFEKMLRFTMLLNSVIMLTMAIVAPNFLMLLFGPKWNEASSYLTILCIGMIFFPAHILNLQLIMAYGKSKEYFSLEVIKKIIGVSVIIGALRYGMAGMCLGIALVNFLSFFVNAFYSKKIIGIGWLRQLKIMLPPLVIGFVAAAAGAIVMEVFLINLGHLYILVFTSACIFVVALILALLDPILRELILVIIASFATKIRYNQK